MTLAKTTVVTAAIHIVTVIVVVAVIARLATCTLNGSSPLATDKL